MAKVKVLLRLPVPEGRIGDTVIVSESRAQMLVDSRYATFVEIVGADTGDDAPADEPEAETEVAATAEQPPTPVNADGPQVDLPAKSAHKSEWEAVAAALGIDAEGLNKAELIEVVTDITG